MKSFVATLVLLLLPALPPSVGLYTTLAVAAGFAALLDLDYRARRPLWLPAARHTRTLRAFRPATSIRSPFRLAA